MTEFLGVEIPMSPWVMLPAIVAATAASAFLINHAVLRAIRGIIQRTSTEIDDRIFRLLERYLFPLLTVGGLLVLVDLISLPEKFVHIVDRSLIILGLALVLFLLTQGTLFLLRSMEREYEPLRNVKAPVELVTKIIFLSVGGMVILDNVGISLAPILTTLGIGSLAVAIALQDTLGNLFAGFYIKADRPIRVGHYIRLESGQEGYVDHIGWRSTHIRALQNNIIVVPNGKLAQNIITNFHLPEKRMSLSIPIMVSADSDPEQVDEILTDETNKALGKIDGLLGDPKPVVRFIPGFGDAFLTFTVICQVSEFVDQYLAQHELRKRIFKRFEREGIRIPGQSQILRREGKPEEGRRQAQRATG